MVRLKHPRCHSPAPNFVTHFVAHFVAFDLRLLDPGLRTQDSGLRRRYARYALVRVTVRVRPQLQPMFTGLGTMVRLQPSKAHPLLPTLLCPP